jgi:hypothetical protein
MSSVTHACCGVQLAAVAHWIRQFVVPGAEHVPELSDRKFGLDDVQGGVVPA